MTLIISTRYGNRNRTKSMARRPRGREKIQMNCKRFGYFPKQFTWRSQRYIVYGVERCWTMSRKRFSSRMNRLCFRVRCAASGNSGARTNNAVLEGTFEIHQDLDTNTWYLDKIVSRT